MQKLNKWFRLVLLTFMLMNSAKNAYAQFTIVKGIVTDAETGEPLPFVNIVADTKKPFGTTSDFSGQYVLQNLEPFSRIKISYLGYKSVIRNVSPSKSQIVNISLEKEAKQLKEVTIKAEKRKYRNKDNPAVELIRLVIDNKDKNRREALDAYEVEKYEKIQFALSNISEKFKNRRYLRKFQFIFENVDTTKLKGKEILPVYFLENISDVYYRNDPRFNKEELKGTRKVNFDEYFDNSGITQFMQYLYQDISIYDSRVTILTNQFTSPISDLGPVFYRYYILDTLMIDTTKCIRLGFFPRNKTDFLLQGDLYITLD
ncbi:MAG: carboxypeptidase-like regulatory domain-containing protein [Bacteroidetes bacterium]|nr:MAG: carboxypeptidase-like regulatory domain-containing protein [Bacteroidota bacterium]